MSKWKKFITYWSMVDLHCCVGFRGTAKSLSYIYVCPLFSRFFPHIGYSRMLSRPPVQYNRSFLIMYLYLVGYKC